MTNIKCICLTPVKNEAWILDKFLRCASLWADHIIIADQNSTDGSKEIARKYIKVTLIDNPSPELNESDRSKLLLDTARKLHPAAKRILVTLDADEFLTANCLYSADWQTILDLPLGTVVMFERSDVRPDLKSCWTAWRFPLAFVDDDSEFSGKIIHGPRLPIPKTASRFKPEEIKVLHYQYTDWARMQSKHRWYQCWERIHRPMRNSIDIYRQYHHMDAISQDVITPIKKEWFDEYEQRGIDMRSIVRDRFYWWDREVIQWLTDYGCAHFKKESIWDVDWNNIGTQIGQTHSHNQYTDPRHIIDKSVHFWLKKTQKYHASNRFVRAIDGVLKTFW